MPRLSRRALYATIALLFITILVLVRDIVIERAHTIKWKAEEGLRSAGITKPIARPPPEAYDMNKPFPDSNSTAEQIDDSAPVTTTSNNDIGSIKNSTLGFGAIFVVGLPDRSDRRDGMALQAGLTGLSIDFIDGVRGDSISEKAIPRPKEGKHLEGGSLGAWRGHMNAIQQVVVRNLSTALIMEDDLDWDVRLKKQCRDLARSSRVLLQPLQSTHEYADQSYPHRTAKKPNKVTTFNLGSLPETEVPTTSPYGDDWDVMWLGHCGISFPEKGNKHISRGRVAHYDDDTVPSKKHLKNSLLLDLLDEYPEHTRVVTHSQGGVCSLAYAVSQRGAQKMLLELGLRDVDVPFDVMLHEFCGGTRGAEDHTCLAVSPGLIHHHRPAGFIGAESDISSHGDDYRTDSTTDNVRWSVRLNAKEILRGGQNYHDGLPDT